LDKSVFSSIAIFIILGELVSIMTKFCHLATKKMGMYVNGPEQFFLGKFAQSHHISRDKKSSQITILKQSISSQQLVAKI
jgi:hypothetical protein